MNSGVYEIVNTVNGKRYIGQASNFKRRWVEHRRTLRRGVHSNQKLQHAWDKYGEAAFVFEVLLICAPTKEALCLFEQRAINVLAPEYNIAPVAGSMLGFKHSPESRARMSIARAGKKLPPRTPEQCAAISARKLGRKGAPLTQAQRDAISARQRGVKRAPGVGAAISRSKRGVPHGPMSPEHKQKISDAHRGKKLSEEHKAKVSRALTGVPHSLERRRAQSLNHPTRRKKVVTV